MTLRPLIKFYVSHHFNIFLGDDRIRRTWVQTSVGNVSESFHSRGFHFNNGETQPEKRKRKEMKLFSFSDQAVSFQLLAMYRPMTTRIFCPETIVNKSRSGIKEFKFNFT